MCPTSWGWTPTVAKMSGSSAARATADRAEVMSRPEPMQIMVTMPAARARASTLAIGTVVVEIQVAVGIDDGQTRAG